MGGIAAAPARIDPTEIEKLNKLNMQIKRMRNKMAKGHDGRI